MARPCRSRGGRPRRSPRARRTPRRRPPTLGAAPSAAWPPVPPAWPAGERASHRPHAGPRASAPRGRARGSRRRGAPSVHRAGASAHLQRLRVDRRHRRRSQQVQLRCEPGARSMQPNGERGARAACGTSRSGTQELVPRDEDQRLAVALGQLGERRAQELAVAGVLAPDRSSARWSRSLPAAAPARSCGGPSGAGWPGPVARRHTATGARRPGHRRAGAMRRGMSRTPRPARDRWARDGARIRARRRSAHGTAPRIGARVFVPRSRPCRLHVRQPARDYRAGRLYAGGADAIV